MNMNNTHITQKYSTKKNDSEIYHITPKYKKDNNTEITKFLKQNKLIRIKNGAILGLKEYMNIEVMDLSEMEVDWK